MKVPTHQGVPFCDNVLAMLKDVEEAVQTRAAVKTAPRLVHCSAGVGRTGTFIVIDHGLRLLARDGAQCSF
jgi:protein tyrosine phosphatase